MFAIIISFISLIGLVILHELGHFLVAKKFGVKVEEFGIFLPPRLIGKKIGETIYSINLLPFGAFVRLYGEEENINDPRSFSAKPFWQKSLIIFGGVITFWIVSFILFTILMIFGMPSIVEDENNNVLNPKVQVISVSLNSPADKSGIKSGDIITKFQVSDFQVPIVKVKQLQELTDKYKGQEIVLTIERLTIEKEKQNFEVALIPRVNPPRGEGAMGVGLVRTGLKSFSWYIAPIEGMKITYDVTIGIIKGWGMALYNLINRKPTGIDLMGPVGIFGLFSQVSELGINYFLHFVAIISIFLALFNIIPIPVTDGGKFVFILIEKIRGKAIDKNIEQKIAIFSFLALFLLMIIVTVKDIMKLLF
jgi:regulator of sigma E protease